MPSSSVADALPLWPVPGKTGHAISDRTSGVPPPGSLYLLQGQPNPNGAPDAALYLLAGNATAGPITEIIPAPGVQMPPSLLPLDGPVRIKLLHFNDFHSHISSFTPQGDVPVFSRIASWLRGTRARHAERSAGGCAGRIGRR